MSMVKIGLNYLIALDKEQINFLFDVLDRRDLPKDEKMVGDIRERLVLGRYGKVLRTMIPAIRKGQRTPKP